MYVTKRGMATAVENLTKNLDNVKEAVAVSFPLSDKKENPILCEVLLRRS